MTGVQTCALPICFPVTIILDKKIADKPQENSKLNLVNKTLPEELTMYLDFIKINNKEEVLQLFNSLGIKI